MLASERRVRWPALIRLTMSIEIREFAAGDYDQVLALWRETEGVVLREVDGREAIERYLALNSGLSWVACIDSTIAGAVLCGTDGRRGYLQHLAVAPAHRRQGLGRGLVNHVLEGLASRGIAKCHLMVLPDNTAGRAFWRSIGWKERPDVLLMSHTQQGAGDA